MNIYKKPATCFRLSIFRECIINILEISVSSYDDNSQTKKRRSVECITSWQKDLYQSGVFQYQLHQFVRFLWSVWVLGTCVWLIPYRTGITDGVDAVYQSKATSCDDIWCETWYRLWALLIFLLFFSIQENRCRIFAPDLYNQYQQGGITHLIKASY